MKTSILSNNVTIYTSLLNLPDLNIVKGDQLNYVKEDHNTTTFKTSEGVYFSLYNTDCIITKMTKREYEILNTVVGIDDDDDFF